MQQPAYHNTHEQAIWSHTPHCFWILSVTGSIWECDWLKTLLPKRRITSALHIANSLQLFCHGKLKLHIHIPGVDGIQGRVEPNTNVWLFSLKCSPITVTKEFKDLQHSNLRLYMHFLLKRHQTALGANISCWSCLISSGSSSTSYSHIPSVFYFFAIYDATSTLVFLHSTSASKGSWEKSDVILILQSGCCGWLLQNYSYVFKTVSLRGVPLSEKFLGSFY